MASAVISTNVLQKEIWEIKLAWKAPPISKFCARTAVLDQRFKYSTFLQELPIFCSN